MPTVGPVTSGSSFDYASPFNHATESAAPGDYRVTLEESATQVELTATNRVACGLSAWYVFSALGIGPVTPGAPMYVVGSPMFEHAEIALPGGRSFTVEAPGASLTGKYVQSATLGGKPLRRAWFFHDAVAAGKTLRLNMGTQPNTDWAAAASARPPSASNTSLRGFGCDAG